MTNADGTVPVAAAVTPASGTSAATAASCVSTVAIDAPAGQPTGAPDVPASDDRAARRVALRDLAAMIGMEVFY